MVFVVIFVSVAAAAFIVVGFGVRNRWWTKGSK